MGYSCEICDRANCKLYPTSFTKGYGQFLHAKVFIACSRCRNRGRVLMATGEFNDSDKLVKKIRESVKDKERRAKEMKAAKAKLAKANQLENKNEYEQ